MAKRRARLIDANYLETIRAGMEVAAPELRMLDILAQGVEGRDTVQLVNALMRLTCLSAIVTGIQSDDFAAGMKHTWDHYANQINAVLLRDSDPKGGA